MPLDMWRARVHFGCLFGGPDVRGVDDGLGWLHGVVGVCAGKAALQPHRTYA